MGGDVKVTEIIVEPPPLSYGWHPTVHLFLVSSVFVPVHVVEPVYVFCVMVVTSPTVVAVIMVELVL